MPLEILNKESSAPIGKDATGSYHGRGRGRTTSRQWTDKSGSTHGTRSIYGNTTSRDNMKDSDDPQFPSLFNFITSFPLIIFATIFCAFLSLKGQVLFLQMHFHFKEELFRHNRVFLLKFSKKGRITVGADDYQSPQSGRITHRVRISTKSTKWTDHP